MHYSETMLSHWIVQGDPPYVIQGNVTVDELFELICTTHSKDYKIREINELQQLHNAAETYNLCWQKSESELFSTYLPCGHWY